MAAPFHTLSNSFHIATLLFDVSYSQDLTVTLIEPQIKYKKVQRNIDHMCS